MRVNNLCESVKTDLEKFTLFLFMRFIVPCITMYGAIKKLCDTNLCNRRLTRIISINKNRA